MMDLERGDFQPVTVGPKLRFSMLLVEDDMAVYQIWELILRQVEDEVDVTWTWVTNGRNAKAELERAEKNCQPFDVVVSDIFFAGGDTGVELWSRFRGRVGAFILTSAMSRPKFEQLFACYGEIPHFIPKPTDPVAAIDIIKRAIQTKGPASCVKKDS